MKWSSKYCLPLADKFNVCSFQNTYIINYPNGTANVANATELYPLIPAGKYRLINRFFFKNETILNITAEIEAIHHHATLW